MPRLPGGVGGGAGRSGASTWLVDTGPPSKGVSTRNGRDGVDAWAPKRPLRTAVADVDSGEIYRSGGRTRLVPCQEWVTKRPYELHN
ncbi:hypothetical protein ACE1SV_11330 [Streptomyces sennicomposti]